MEKVQDLELVEKVLGFTTKVEEIKEKLINCTSNLKVCSEEDCGIGLKRQDTDWEKIIANHIFNKGLIYWIFKILFNK